MAKKKNNRKEVARKRVDTSSKGVSQGIAIVALLVNILILPGLGSIIGGRTKTGVIQLVVAIISIPFMVLIIGIPVFIAMWVWGIITGIQIIQGAK